MNFIQIINIKFIGDNVRRIIARLDIKNEYEYGIQMEGLMKVGDPTELATKYYKFKVDELLFMDAVAILYSEQLLS